MTEPAVLHTTAGHVLSLTLNRPEALNALTPAQRDEIVRLLSEASASAEVRAVVLTGTGRGFCAGADLRATAAPTAARVAGDVARTLRTGAQRLIAAVLDCEKPVIAAVNG
ncbi:enoyl-CoA hydratase/isomerase family protein, partial [Streptomyces africanus]|uniref:enoyl-CoA hydratase/isomerase family protein n=1 Tax=Streptomyces africanus TaxID=231024 RepID=UPI001FC9AC9B